MNAREYFTVLRESRLLIAGCVVVCVALAYVLAAVTPKTYSASATFYVFAEVTAAPGSPNPASDSLQGAQLSLERVKSYIELATSYRIAEDAAGRLADGTSPADVQSAVTATSTEETVLFTLSATAGTPERAVAIARAVSDSLGVLIEDLETPFGGEVPLVNAQIVQRPIQPESPVSPVLQVNLAIGLLLGLVIGFGVAIGRRSFDLSVRSADALDRIDAPVLGVVPEDPGTSREPVAMTPTSRTLARTHARAEAYRRVRTNLTHVTGDRDGRVLVISSALPEDGKSVTVCNLAAAFAAVGTRVLLIDANLRRPKADLYLGLSPAAGLTEVLADGIPFGQAVRSSAAGGFDVLSSGRVPATPSELLSSRRASEVLTEVRGRYDVVLIDTPPLLPVVDAADIAARADGVVLVCRWGRTSLDDVESAVSLLRSVSVPVLGTVLSRIPARTRSGRGPYASPVAAPAASLAAEPTPTPAGEPAAGNGTRPRSPVEMPTARALPSLPARVVPAQKTHERPVRDGRDPGSATEMAVVPAGVGARNGHRDPVLAKRPSPRPRPGTGSGTPPLASGTP